MSDLEYYTSKYPLPALSMIADCGFPVCYGEKGILEGAAVSGRDFSDEVLELYGGSAGNIIPDRAVLVLVKGQKFRKDSWLLCRHRFRNV